MAQKYFIIIIFISLTIFTNAKASESKFIIINAPVEGRYVVGRKVSKGNHRCVKLKNGKKHCFNCINLNTRQKYCPNSFWVEIRHKSEEGKCYRYVYDKLSYSNWDYLEKKYKINYIAKGELIGHFSSKKENLEPLILEENCDKRHEYIKEKKDLLAKQDGIYWGDNNSRFVESYKSEKFCVTYKDSEKPFCNINKNPKNAYENCRIFPEENNKNVSSLMFNAHEVWSLVQSKNKDGTCITHVYQNLLSFNPTKKNNTNIKKGEVIGEIELLRNIEPSITFNGCFGGDCFLP